MLILNGRQLSHLDGLTILAYRIGIESLLVRTKAEIRENSATLISALIVETEGTPSPFDHVKGNLSDAIETHTYYLWSDSPGFTEEHQGYLTICPVVRAYLSLQLSVYY